MLLYLEWDSSFFKKKIGRIDIKRNSVKVESFLDLASESDYELIYLFSEIGTTLNESIFNNYNGKKVDTKVIFSKKIKPIHNNITNIESYDSKLLNPELLALTYQSGEYSRFRTDEKLVNNEFEKLYHEWIKKSISKDLADEIFVFKENEKIKGMVTVSISKNEGNIGLIAVDKTCRGKGVGKQLLSQVESYLLSKNITVLNIATQKENNIAFNFYSKQGFSITRAWHIYHFWLK